MTNEEIRRITIARVKKIVMDEASTIKIEGKKKAVEIGVATISLSGEFDSEQLNVLRECAECVYLEAIINMPEEAESANRMLESMATLEKIIGVPDTTLRAVAFPR